MYYPERITSLQDGQATKSAIRQALIQIERQAGKKQDTVVFYFSGHGYVYVRYGTSSL